MKFTLAVALPLMLAGSTALANDYTPALTSYLDNEISGWGENATLVAAITAANAERAGIDQAQIDAMDAAWRAEVGTANTPTITPILENPAADFLRAQVDASGGKIVEAFVTDAVGLNVATSAPTSDMWQGDEDKFTKVFPSGILLGDVELDESSQTYQAQISITIVDPATKAAIGTLTVGVNADSLL